MEPKLAVSNLVDWYRELKGVWHYVSMQTTLQDKFTHVIGDALSLVYECCMALIEVTQAKYA